MIPTLAQIGLLQGIHSGRIVDAATHDPVALMGLRRSGLVAGVACDVTEQGEALLDRHGLDNTPDPEPEPEFVSSISAELRAWLDENQPPETFSFGCTPGHFRRDGAAQ